MESGTARSIGIDSLEAPDGGPLFGSWICLRFLGFPGKLWKFAKKNSASTPVISPSFLNKFYLGFILLFFFSNCAWLGFRGCESMEMDIHIDHSSP